MKSSKTLIVEHDELSRQQLDDVMTVLEHRYETATCLADARQLVTAGMFRYILLSDELPTKVGRPPRRQNADAFMEYWIGLPANDRPLVILMVNPMPNVADIDKMRWSADMRSRGVAEFIEKPLPARGRTPERVIRKLLGGGRPLPDLEPSPGSKTPPAAGLSEAVSEPVATSPGAVVGVAVPGVLTSNERDVLEALSERRDEPQMLVELAEASGYSKNTTRKSLDHLQASGYAARPRGPRGGYAVTPQGLALLGKGAGDVAAT